jgi:hypothetical protein
MCSSPAPVVQSPPAPIPKRDEVIDARMSRQAGARRAAVSGYESTMLSDQSQGTPSSAPVLGG